MTKVRTAGAQCSEGLRINSNREVWHEVYANIRRLAVKKAMLIHEFTECKISPQKVCVYRYGKAVYKKAFDLLSQDQKSQIVTLMNQMASMYTQLHEMQAAMKA